MLVWLTTTSTAYAQVPTEQLQTVQWPGDQAALVLGPHLQYLIDESGEASLHDVRQLAQSNWTQNETQVPSFGFTTEVYWFRTQVNPPNIESNASWFLRIAYPLLDDVNVFVLGEDSNGHPTHKHLQFGDRVPFGDREVDHREFLLPVKPPESPIQIYVRVETTSSLQVPLSIVNQRDFLVRDEGLVLAYGLLFGSMLIMILYNIIIFLWTRETNYLTYCIYAVFLMLLFVGLSGMSFQYLWPNSLVWHEKSVVVIIGGAMAAAVAFNRSFLSLKEQLPWADKLGFLLFVACVGIVAAAFPLPYAVGIKLAVAALIPYCIYAIATALLLLQRGYAPARYYVLSWAAVVVGSILLGLSRSGFLPVNAFTNNGILVGATAQLMLLSYALADRVNQIKAEKDRIQKFALDEQQKAAAQLQVALTKAEAANKLKSEFLANISHELRTPLNAIVNLPSGLLKSFEPSLIWTCTACGAQFQTEGAEEVMPQPGASQDCPECSAKLECREESIFIGDSREQMHFLSRIETSGRHLLAVVNDLLDISKLEADRMTIYPVPVHVSDVLSEVRNTMQSLADEKQVELVFPEAGEDLVLDADRVKLTQILINLIGNAVKFTASGGKVTTQVSPDLLREEAALRFEVEDTGQGMPASALNLIFESFRQVDGSHTRQHQGTGLGLAITSRLVELHEGTIDVASSEGEGSRFWFILPRDQSSTERAVD